MSGQTIYTYVNGNPLSSIDPMGLLDQLVFNGTTLTGYDDSAVEFSVPAVSGPWGKGPLPQGVYNGGNLRKRKDNKAMMCSDGSGWSLDLDPAFETSSVYTERNSDADQSASEGCVVAGPKVRKKINNSPDRTLQVVR